MIPNGLYVFLGTLVIAMGVEFFLLLFKFKKDGKDEVKGILSNKDSSKPALDSTPKDAGLDFLLSDKSTASTSSTSSTPSILQFDEDEVDEIAEEGNPLWQSSLYFILASTALIIVALAIQFIFEA